MGCNYMSVPLISTSGKTLLNWRLSSPRCGHWPVSWSFGHHPRAHALQFDSSSMYSFSLHGVQTQQQWTLPRWIWNQDHTTRCLSNFYEQAMCLVSWRRCDPWGFNPLRAIFFRDNINRYLHFMSFLHTNETQVFEIPPRVRQGPAYST